MKCDNCISPLDDYENEQHRCRADVNSCVEGVDCPDYIESCDCVCNAITIKEYGAVYPYLT